MGENDGRGRPLKGTARIVGFTLRVEPAQLERLRELSSQTRIPMSEYVREGVAMRIDEEETRDEAHCAEDRDR